MAGTRRYGDLVFLPGELLALVVPFLPIDRDHVPVLMLSERSGLIFAWIALQQLILVPFVLGAAIAASTVRQAVAGPLSRPERIGAYALAFAALAATAFASVDLLVPLGPVIGPTFLLAAVGAIAILAATRKSRVPAHVHAHLALLSAWIVNAGLTVIVFLKGSMDVGVGCWLAATSVAAIAVEAVLRARRALRSEGDAGAEAGPS